MRSRYYGHLDDKSSTNPKSNSLSLKFVTFHTWHSLANVAPNRQILHTPVECFFANGALPGFRWFEGSEGLEISAGVELYEYQGMPNDFRSANSGRFFVF